MLAHIPIFAKLSPPPTQQSQPNFQIKGPRASPNTGIVLNELEQEAEISHGSSN